MLNCLNLTVSDERHGDNENVSKMWRKVILCTQANKKLMKKESYGKSLTTFVNKSTENLTQNLNF